MRESIYVKMQTTLLALDVGRIALENLYKVSLEELYENQEELNQQMTGDIEFNGINGNIYGK
jgi:hypothetical protein